MEGEADVVGERESELRLAGRERFHRLERSKRDVARHRIGTRAVGRAVIATRSIGQPAGAVAAGSASGIVPVQPRTTWLDIPDRYWPLLAEFITEAAASSAQRSAADQ
jgi:hypothetical protein